MIDVTALAQVKAFARQDGVFLALLWVAGFLLMVLVPSSSWGSMLTLSSPLFVGWLLTRFRDYALDKKITFRRGYVYSCYTFLYAALLFALAQYIFFRYFDHGAMLSMLSKNVAILESAQTANEVNMSDTIAQMNMGLELIRQMIPIQLAFIFMMQNLFIGWIASIPIALFCRK